MKNSENSTQKPKSVKPKKDKATKTDSKETLITETTETTEMKLTPELIAIAINLIRNLYKRIIKEKLISALESWKLNKEIAGAMFKDKIPSISDKAFSFIKRTEFDSFLILEDSKENPLIESFEICKLHKGIYFNSEKVSLNPLPLKTVNEILQDIKAGKDTIETIQNILKDICQNGYSGINQRTLKEKIMEFDGLNENLFTDEKMKNEFVVFCERRIKEISRSKKSDSVLYFENALNDVKANDYLIDFVYFDFLANKNLIKKGYMNYSI